MRWIRANSEPDLFFGQGFVSCQLRLWQMEFQRRVVAGRLSELVGSAGLDTDKLMRALGLYRAAAESLQHLDAPTLVAVQSYTKGVNAFMQDVGNGTRPKPLEFLVFGIAVEPWTDTDSVAWLKMMAYELGGNMHMELSRYALLARERSRGAEVRTPPCSSSRGDL